MKPETIRAIALAVLAALIFAAGWAVEGYRMRAEISQLNESHAGEIAKAAQENAKTLADAHSKSDALLLQLNGWKDTLTAFAQEKDREISRLTTGRRCLDSNVVSVLNRTSPKLNVGAVPQAIGSALRTNAGSAQDTDDGAYATDTDVATWINTCQLGYDTCRGRLDSIREFYGQ